MSSIRCSENCIHQKNGYCNIDEVTCAAGKETDPCIYYRPSDKDTAAEKLENSVKM